MNPDSWIPLTIIIPLFGAAIAFVARPASRWIGLASLVGVVVPIWLCAKRVLLTGAQIHEAGGWSASLGIDLYLDGAAALMLCVTWVIGVAVAIYAPAYFGDKEQERNFWPLCLFLLAGLNALFLSRDVFNLYVTLEIVGIAAVALVALPAKKEALTAAMRYLLVSLLGSLVFLLGVAFLYAEYSTVDQRLLAERIAATPATFVATAAMTGGLLMKAALFPLHFWLPPAHANAPAPVSALLSALVVKGSLFIIIRLWTQVFADVIPFSAAQLLGTLGAAAIFWGSLQALIQTRLKMLIAYSTVAQLGYLFLIFPLFMTEGRPQAAWAGCFFFIAAHACAKTAMFLAAGSILKSAGHDRIAELASLTKAAPISVAAFGIAGVSIIGLPPSGGFLGKWMLLNAALGEGQWWWVAVIAVGGLLAAAYILRVLVQIFSDVSPDPNAIRPPAAMQWTAFAMSVLAILLGLLSAVPIELASIESPAAAGPLLKGGPTP